MKNIRMENHGNSYKQAFMEHHIQKMLEEYRAHGNLEALKEELRASRFDIFKLDITELQSHLDMNIVFDYLQNLNDLTITFGAKHVGMEYESSLFGMKM